MPEPNGLTPEQRELETALAGLTPAPARFDPVAAAFTAGERSARRSVRLWQGVAAAVTLAAVSVSLLSSGREALVAPRPHPEPAPSALAKHSVPEPSPPRRLSDQSLARLQQALRRNGLEGLPQVHLPSVRISRAADGGFAELGEI